MSVITGSNWPNISMQELNTDWIFRELIPAVQSLKQSYDNIQDAVRQITQQNYNEWRAELTRELGQLQTQLNQSNESWRQQFTVSNTTWQQTVSNNLDARFIQWSSGQDAAIEMWEHNAYNQLQQLVNSFADSIADAEARAKDYALTLNTEQRAYIQQQVHLLNDEISAVNAELAKQVELLNTSIAAIADDLLHHKQDVEAEIMEFEDNIVGQFNQHKTDVQQSLASMQTYINEQVRLLNVRISALTAGDIAGIDPLSGETEDVQYILRHMFDVFSEYNGCITAEEYKQLEITAGEYKEKYNYNAILYSVASYWLLKIRKWERPAFYYNGEYVTPAELEQRLMNYITKAAVDAELADYALTNDVDQKLAQYIKTKDMISYLATTLENYVTYDDLQNTLQDYARPEDLQQLQAELDQKATQEQLESLRQAVYVEFDKYAKLSELPDFSEFLKSSDAADIFATLDDLNKYALKTELPDVSGLLSKAEAADQYVLSTRFESEMQEMGLQMGNIARRQDAMETVIDDVANSNNINNVNIINLQNNKQDKYVLATFNIEGNKETAVVAHARNLSGNVVFNSRVLCAFGDDAVLYFSAFPPLIHEPPIWSTSCFVFANYATQNVVVSLANIPNTQKMNWDVLNVNIYTADLSWDFQQDIIDKRPIVATIYSTNSRSTTTGTLSFIYRYVEKKLYVMASIPFYNPNMSELTNEIYIYLSTHDTTVTRE